MRKASWWQLLPPSALLWSKRAKALPRKEDLRIRHGENQDERKARGGWMSEDMSALDMNARPRYLLHRRAFKMFGSPMIS